MITVTPAMIVFLAQGQTQLYMCSVFGQGPSHRQISTKTISTLVPLRSTNEPYSKSGRFFALHRSSPRLQPRPLSREIHRLARQSGRRGERSEEHTSELQSHLKLVCRLLLEKKKKYINSYFIATKKKKKKK